MLTDTRSLDRLDQRWIEVGLWAGMGLGLALCYLSGAMPVMLAGLLLFGGLAALRPDLALLFVPLTAPLFLTPIVLPASGRQFALPPHELALLATAAVTLPSFIARYIIPEVRQLFRQGAAVWLPNFRYSIILPIVIGAIPVAPQPGMRRLARAVARYAPEALLLIAGIAGISMAVPEPQARADAWRAFRWFIVEPLIFVALIRSAMFWPPAGARTQARRLLNLFVIGGAAVALLGLFQFANFLLHAQIAPESYAAGGGLLGRIQRVTSVYGNPNNMALYLGRVWPLAAALAFTKNREPRIARLGSRFSVLGSWFLVLGSLLCLAGIVISLSRGAWLGAGAALIVLLLPVARYRFGGRRWPGALIVAAIMVAIGALIFGLRGGPLGGSADVRILFWQESIKLLERRPLGVGLDQFFYYHDPAYGRSLIDPLLATTQERDARQPHNLVFEIWLNLGPLGIIAFGGLLAGCLRRARATLRSPPSADAALLTRAVIAALTAALVHGMVDSFYFWPDIAIAFWLLVGVSELLAQHSRSSAR